MSNAELIERLENCITEQKAWADDGESTIVGDGPYLMREAIAALSPVLSEEVSAQLVYLRTRCDSGCEEAADLLERLAEQAQRERAYQQEWADQCRELQQSIEELKNAQGRQDMNYKSIAADALTGGAMYWIRRQAFGRELETWECAKFDDWYHGFLIIGHWRPVVLEGVAEIRGPIKPPGPKNA